MNILSKILSAFRRVFIGYTTPPCVGIDISSSAIKIVELNMHTLKIKNYSIKTLHDGLISPLTSSINDLEAVSGVVSQQWSLFKHNVDNVAIAMPYSAIIIREISAPIIKSKLDLDKYVLEQLVLDLGLDDIDFDYSVIEKLEEIQKLRVVVAKKDKLDEYQAMIQMTGINVAAIDVEPFAIQNLYRILLHKKHIKKNVVVLDISYNQICGYLFKNYEPIYFNDISTNYNYIFEEYVQEHNIKIGRNENVNVFMVDYLIKHKVILNKLIETITLDINKLIQIIKSSILVEKKLTLNSDFVVYLMGELALLPELSQMIAKNNNIKVHYSDELLRHANANIPHQHLIRLITAVSLATWGHKIDEN